MTGTTTVQTDTDGRAGTANRRSLSVQRQGTCCRLAGGNFLNGIVIVMCRLFDECREFLGSLCTVPAIGIVAQIGIVVVGRHTSVEGLVVGHAGTIGSGGEMLLVVILFLGDIDCLRM